MTLTWLAVTPLDTIMVRDGRPFDAGATGTARSVAPLPSTLGGAVRTAVGRDIHLPGPGGLDDGHLVGPVVDTALGPMFPVPADVVRDDRILRRLAMRPRRTGSASDLDDRLRLDHAPVGDGDPLREWISGGDLAAWLRADARAAPGEQVDISVHRDPAWVPENRLGLARRWRGPLAGTASPGMLYAMTQLRPREGTRLLVGCADADRVAVREEVVPLGGRGRLAHVDVLDGPTPLPDPPDGFPGGRLVVYLATPALVDLTTWQAPSGARLCAVLTGGPEPVATASPRAGFAESRSLVWAVPAGSVLYLQFDGADGAAAAAHWSKAHHGRLLPGQLDVRMVSAGFGTCLTGRW